jgi:hypothetical protein
MEKLKGGNRFGGLGVGKIRKGCEKIECGLD